VLDLAAKRGVKVNPLKHSFHHEYRYAPILFLLLLLLFYFTLFSLLFFVL